MKNLLSIALIAMLGLFGLDLLWRAGPALADSPPALDAGPVDGHGVTAPTGAFSAADYATLPLAPADKLHDPVASPLAAWDDVTAARKIGWPVAVLAGLVMICKGLGAIGRRKGKIAWAWLGSGKVPIVIGAIGAIAAAAYNALVLGGTLLAAGFAAIVSASHYFDAAPAAK